MSAVRKQNCAPDVAFCRSGFLMQSVITVFNRYMYALV